MANDRWWLRLRLLQKVRTNSLTDKELIAAKMLVIGMCHKNQLGIHAVHGGSVVKPLGKPDGWHTVALNVEADNAMDNLHVTGIVHADIPDLSDPVDDNSRKFTFTPLIATHTNPPHSLIKRTRERVKGVLHRGH